MTEAEIIAEIAEIDKALSYIRNGGQSYTITSASSGGTARTVTQADYDVLVKHRNDLYNQLRADQGTRAFRLRSGW